MAKQLLGKEVTAALNERIKADVAALKEKGINPTLGIIRVGENESDISYERGATKRCETLGVACEKILLPAVKHYKYWNIRKGAFRYGSKKCFQKRI